MSEATLTTLLRLAGATHLLLAISHAILWRLFRWRTELDRLTPLTARVFVVHMLVVVFVLVSLGTLAFLRPDVLVTRSDAGRYLAGAFSLLWVGRALAQPFVFDPVLLRGHWARPLVRGLALALFSLYAVLYGATFLHQLG